MQHTLVQTLLLGGKYQIVHTPLMYDGFGHWHLVPLASTMWQVGS